MSHVQELRQIARGLPVQQCRHVRVRPFSTSRQLYQQQQQHRKESFRSRLRTALSGTKIQWKPIPVGLGIAFLGGLQLYRTQARRNAPEEEDQRAAERGDRSTDGVDSEGQPKRRKRIRPSGPW